MARAKPPSAEGGAVLLSFEGEVKIAASGSTNWVGARTNQALLPGDQLRTGRNSRAIVRSLRLGQLRVRESSILTIMAPRDAGARPVIDLLRGFFYFFNRDRAIEVELRDRLASATTRGTEFLVAVTEQGQMTVSVLEGEVDLRNGAGTLSLSSGEQGVVSPNEPPRPGGKIQAINLIQWCLYYPAVLDEEELGLSESERLALQDSLARYRLGDVLGALRSYPDNRQPASNAERAYRAALLLAAGEVDQSRAWLEGLPAGFPAAEALRQVVAAVQFQTYERKGTPSLGSEWLAQSYYEQSRASAEPTRLLAALKAARSAAAKSPQSGYAWERVGELEFCFGHIGNARAALETALKLSPRNAQALALKGFLLCAQNDLTKATESFEAALAADSGLANGWLGRGLCLIKRGRTAEGRADLLTAAAVEPQRALLRSYLGKAFADANDDRRAAKELALARELDPNDPTSWLYSALFLRRQNRINEGIGDLEGSQRLGDNRSLFRSRLLLDEDRAVRGANLAGIYQDAGMDEVAVREATRAVESDYANYSAHLFLADSYNALRDPRQIDLRYETPWLSEYLVGNLLAPAQSATLSPMVSQQEYGRLLERNRLGLTSLTEYSSRGDWLQAAAQHGQWDKSAYAFEENYRSRNGYGPNNAQEQLTLSLALKQEVSPQDSFFFQAVYYDANQGDLTPYYNPADADPNLHFTERQQPLLLVGYHHEWAPGIHTLMLAGRLQDTVTQTTTNGGTFYEDWQDGRMSYLTPAIYSQNYENRQEIYTAELQQILTYGEHSMVLGSRYQTGEFHTQSSLSDGMIYTQYDPTHRIGTGEPGPIQQSSKSSLERFTAYAYEDWRVLPPLLLVGGCAYDRLRYPGNFQFAPVSGIEQPKDQFGPKAGVVWTPGRDTAVRFAYTRSLGGVSFDQSFRLEPSQVAGFNQAFRSIMPEAVVGPVSAPTFETFGLQWEQKLPSKTYLGVTLEMLRSKAGRDLGAEGFFVGSSPQQGYLPVALSQALDYEERSLQATLNQLVGPDLALGAAYRLSCATCDVNYPDVPADTPFGQYLSGQNFTTPNSRQATLHQVRLYGLLNLPSGFFCGAEGLWTLQENEGYAPPLPGANFWQANVFAGYRLFRRHAELRVALLNVTDQDYRLNPLNLMAELPRERTLTVSFGFSF